MRRSRPHTGALQKKYHPDKYRGHDLEDLAGEKLKEINEAYDIIQRGRQSGSRYSHGAGASSSSGSYSSGSYSGSSTFADVRRAMQAGDLTRADAMLDQMSSHNAEWHYWKGQVLLRKGWYDGARQHFASACSMEPGNTEYARAFNTVNQSASGYGQTFYGMRGGQSAGPDACTCCSSMLCADCCCECMGGDCISCC